MKILLVEDSATIRYAMCAYIENAGHETIVAESGEQALQIIDTTPVDMVIMDVEMPGLDGFETTKLIREWLGDHWIPIIFVTGKSEASSLEEGISAGGDDYLIKPVNQVILNAKISAMERITEMRNQLAKLNEELTILSQRDDLTQLYNRRTFEQKAADLWDYATRHKTPFTIILLDIDHFKLYNDCYGHPAGDKCIQEVARALLSSLNRSADLAARYGGEEFIAVLPDTHEEGAKHVCETIRSAVEALEIRHRDSSVSKCVTVSIGATVVNYTTGTDLIFQIDQADRALYCAKRAGRNQAIIREFNPYSKVLVVDENEESLESSCQILRGHCSVIPLSHSEDCANFAEEYYPDLILLDIKPDSNHQQICQKLKNNDKTRSIPVILMCESGIEELKRFGQQVHANGCITKPFEANQLIAKVNQFLNLN
ncbi:diguanylate cyclase [Agarilytica rhodophyticola]|uniref:diguanylate cyclase n=1 Tax=Agarilytica rhodophyticola TaxID=1737490 RepID=UPI000B348E36|nr:diguanylate cyclase [Agarilytica rhodophyticola]